MFRAIRRRRRRHPDFRGIDLLAGGAFPCPPFSMAGKQLGVMMRRDLFPEALRLVAEAKASRCNAGECCLDSPDGGFHDIAAVLSTAAPAWF